LVVTHQKIVVHVIRLECRLENARVPPLAFRARQLDGVKIAIEYSRAVQCQ
jgi:hypothetical protein